MVYGGLWNGKPIAFKTFKVSVTQTKSEKWKIEVRREIEHLCKLVHPNLADVYGPLLLTGVVILVMEYLPCSLYQAMFVEKRIFSELEKSKLLRQVSEALEFLHSNEVVLCNLTSKNVYLGYFNRPKIESCGPRLFKDKKSDRVTGEFQVNKRYAAPEIVHKGLFASEQLRKADVYSLAIVAYELLEGEEACERLPSKVQGIDKEDIKAYPFFRNSKVSLSIYDILIKCWDCNPDKRPEAADFTQFWKRV